MTKLQGLVPKGWGSEFIWATNDKYCGKFMDFNTGAKFSMHFHKDKEETWYVQRVSLLFDGLILIPQSYMKKKYEMALFGIIPRASHTNLNVSKQVQLLK